jgi:hypothetical protein
MLTRLRLERFKNFKEAELQLGPFTLLVGTNASGKSNLRDAFRFLHGVSRGYTLGEIFGEKYGEGGEKQWHGVRGGTREASFQGAPTFALECAFEFPSTGLYRIEVEVGSNGTPPRVAAERLAVGQRDYMYDSHPEVDTIAQTDPYHLLVRLGKPVHNKKNTSKQRDLILFHNTKPILTQLQDDDQGKRDSGFLLGVQGALRTFRSMRFLELNPDAMRQPSFPGQITLGDRGENLSSVLQAICEDPARKQTLISWLQELTPMDANDFDFPPDQIGRILLTLIEKNGQRVSAYSASDGTLRFLALLAAILGPEPARFYFIEELENGIHPTRLHLLLDLIEHQVSERNIQIVATTHSPQLLGLLSPQSREHASLIYRLPDHPEARIRRILDIPETRRVLEQDNLTRLHSLGWLEHAVEYLEEQETPA